MKVAKIKNKNKKEQIEELETYSLKNMIKILIILLIIFGSFYFITTLFVKNKEVVTENEPVVVDSEKIILSQILNRDKEEYYVLATKPSLYSSSFIELYNDYINDYKQKEDSIAFYFVDLDNALNKKYYGEDLNITNEISELKINDEVLFKIKSGKIEKTYIGKDEILDKLSRM